MARTIEVNDSNSIKVVDTVVSERIKTRLEMENELSTLVKKLQEIEKQLALLQIVYDGTSRYEVSRSELNYV